MKYKDLCLLNLNISNNNFDSNEVSLLSLALNQFINLNSLYLNLSTNNIDGKGVE